MGFKCGIVGLPNVGKSTLFNALTESNKAEAANYPFATIEPNIGRVAVNDKRLKKLTEISKSQKAIPTYIDIVDIAGLVKGASDGEGLGNKFLANIREVDTIIHVVRCFENENISHISSNIDPINDIEIVETELKLSDIQRLQNKANELEKKSKSNDKKIKYQLDITHLLIDKLNNNLDIYYSDFTENENIFIKNLNLISSKKKIYVCNVDENSIINGNNFSDKIKEIYKKKQNEFILISASAESQIAQIEDYNEKIEFLNDIGLKETTLDKMIKLGYESLDLITFFTSGPKETRAWTIKKNTTALHASGKIHSDIEKGFIKAETISYNDFVENNGESKCRELGKLRQEGKDYKVKDGDIFHFLFNI